MLVYTDVVGAIVVVRLGPVSCGKMCSTPWSESSSVHIPPSENAKTSDILEESAGAICKRPKTWGQRQKNSLDAGACLCGVKAVNKKL
jgi:hypothetical protein